MRCGDYDLDGAWSLGDQWTLFGTKAAADLRGGAIRCVDEWNGVGEWAGGRFGG